nr:hypothetical protein BaRGS_008718 [Batillaria attramentaria]
MSAASVTQNPHALSAWLLLLEADWRDALSLLIEQMEHLDENKKDRQSQLLTYTEESEFKVKAAVVETAKRLSLRRRMVLVTSDEKLLSSTRRMIRQAEDDDEALSLVVVSPEEKQSSAQQVIYIDHSGPCTQGPSLFVDKNEFRLLLLGRTGSGRSTTGNTILGEKLFRSSVPGSFTSETSKCEVNGKKRNGIEIKVMDSPGLFDTSKDDKTISVEVRKAVVGMHGGLDAVLYVLKIGPYTEEELGVYKRLKAILGDDIKNYTIVVFTHGDLLGGKNIKRFTMADGSFHFFLVTCLAMMALFLQATPTLAMPRERRSDDYGALDVVVNGLSEKLTQLTAQLQAVETRLASQEAANTQIETKLDVLDHPVVFTVRFRTLHVTGLGAGQTLKFDDVRYNAGGGYSPVNGLFTAPSSGSYAFFLELSYHDAVDVVEYLLEQPVVFTVMFKSYHITGLGSAQTLKFDDIRFSAGGGYSPVTGFFTAPSSGTYAFSLQATLIMGSGKVFAQFMTLVLAMVVMVHVTPTLALNRDRRSDDYGALDVVVNGLSEKLTQLTAQLQTQDAKLTHQEAEITSLTHQLNNQIESRLDSLEQPVAFTVRLKTLYIHGLGKGQTLKFDSVSYNAGGGYSPVTGLFTAPLSGTYVFMLESMFLSDDPLTLAIMKGGSTVAAAYVCCDVHDRTSQTVTVHLNKGDTMHVQVAEGTSMAWRVVLDAGFLRVSNQAPLSPQDLLGHWFLSRSLP